MHATPPPRTRRESKTVFDQSKVLGKMIDRRNERAPSVMGLGEHLQELRKRLIYAIVGLIPIFIVACIYGRQILDIVLMPVRAALHNAGEPSALQTTSVFEVFYNAFKASAIVTLIIGGPWIIYQLWQFVAPGLYSRERRFVYILAPLSMILSLCALAFMYFIIMPTMLGFLITFNAGTFNAKPLAGPLPPGITLPTIPVLKLDPIDPPLGAEWINTEVMERRTSIGPGHDGKVIVVGTPVSQSGGLLQQFRVGETLDTFVTFALGCAVAFQTPVVVLLLGWAGIVTTQGLRTYWRHVFVACAVLGAVLTPSPDPASMLLLTIPMYLLYELGLTLLWLLPAKRVAGYKAQPSNNNDGPADGP